MKEATATGSSPRICSRCVLPDTFPGIFFDQDGVCSECRRHMLVCTEWEASRARREAVLEQICDDARRRHKAFDALVPLSGGKDSTYVLYTAVKKLGLRCLTFTLDNGYLSDLARHNVEAACRKLGAEHIYYQMDPQVMNRLFALFMRKTGDFCSICMRAIGMATERMADIYDTPLILQGSSSRTELVLSREMFEPGPVPFVQSVLQGEPVAADSQHLLYETSLRRRLGYRVFRSDRLDRVRYYGSIKLPNMMDWHYATILRTITEELDWQAAPGDAEHADCIIHPITTYAHNRRFPGLEIRRLTLARLIMVGQISREEALRELEREQEDPRLEPVMEMFLANIQMTREDFDRYIDLGPRHLAFPHSYTRRGRLAQWKADLFGAPGRPVPSGRTGAIAS